MKAKQKKLITYTDAFRIWKRAYRIQSNGASGDRLCFSNKKVKVIKTWFRNQFGISTHDDPMAGGAAQFLNKTFKINTVDTLGISTKVGWFPFCVLKVVKNAVRRSTKSLA